MKVVLCVAFVLILIVSVALSETAINEDVAKLNTTQPIQPRAPEKRSSKYAKIKAAREAAERKLKELAAELEALKSAEVDVPMTKTEQSGKAPPAPAPAPLRAPEKPIQGSGSGSGMVAPVGSGSGMVAPGLKASGLAAPSPNRLPSSEIVDMDEIPVQQSRRSSRRVVTKRVTSKKVTKKAQAKAEWDKAHHDVHEYDNSHWVEIDGEMTRLHTKSQDKTSDDLVYHGSEDDYAKLNGSHGHKIPDHEITRTKRRTNITRRPRRKTTEELNGGFQAPKPTFYGMWTGQNNLNGGYKAPVPGVYGGNKYKQEI